MVSERITVVMDKQIIMKLRTQQAKEIQDTLKSVSFSKVLNGILRKALKIKDE